MGISLSPDRLNALAPDTQSVKAAKKLAKSKHWQNTGQSPEAMWGDCQGSALYQIRIEVSTFTISCTCPSHKQPCKHGLALLMLAMDEPEAVPELEAPEWIDKWLAKRASITKRKETIQNKRAEGEEPSAEQLKTAEKRLALVKQGLEQLDLWLSDLVRNGLGSIGQKSDRIWQDEAAQMVDAQAPGLASRLRRMATIPNASANWPERLLAELGELQLLTQAFHHIEQLDPALQEEIRQMIGWSRKEADVSQLGERVRDRWLFLGQREESIDQGYTQRTWLQGHTTRRIAMLNQFRTAQQSFPKAYPIGREADATLVYWPGTLPQRAFVEEIDTPLLENKLLKGALPGEPTIQAFLSSIAQVLAQQPWRNRFLCVLRESTLFYQQASSRWWIRDQQGQALPLGISDAYWTLLAISGGHPVDIAAEWNGETLLLLGAQIGQSYILC